MEPGDTAILRSGRAWLFVPEDAFSEATTVVLMDIYQYGELRAIAYADRALEGPVYLTMEYGGCGDVPQSLEMFKLVHGYPGEDLDALPDPVVPNALRATLHHFSDYVVASPD